VQVQGAFAEKQLFIGKGAGSYPTGSAVLSDLSALSYDYSYEYKKLNQTDRFEFSNGLVVEAYISFDATTNISIQDFEKFDSGYAANGKQYMVGQVRLSKLREWVSLGNVGIILAPNASFIPVAVATAEAVA
jgi:homoserine dehydrogenase